MIDTHLLLRLGRDKKSRVNNGADLSLIVS